MCPPDRRALTWFKNQIIVLQLNVWLVTECVLEMVLECDVEAPDNSGDVRLSSVETGISAVSNGPAWFHTSCSVFKTIVSCDLGVVDLGAGSK